MSPAKNAKVERRGPLWMIAFAVATLAAWALGLSSAMNYVFTPAAFALAVYLFRGSRRHYFSFLLWLWLLTPEVRRLVDFKTTYHPLSLVQLAPYAATSLTLILVFKHLPKLSNRHWFPFVLCVLGVLQGYFVGVLKNGIPAATYDLLNWLLPISLALSIALESVRDPEILQRFFSTMCPGLLIVSIYGIVQFYYLPPWDAYWLLASHFGASNVAQEQNVRVFGPLNSPGAYAIMLHVGLLYAIAANSRLKWLATGLAIPAFALCLVRSSWGAFALGLLFIFVRARTATRVRLTLAVIASAAVAFPLLSVNVVADRLSSRLNSIGSLHNDSSYKNRVSFYSNSFAASFTEPLGRGLGSTGTSAQLATGIIVVFDSGIMLIPVTLGWLGAILYSGGAIWLVGANLIRLRTRQPIAVVAAAVAWGLFAEMVFAQTMVGFTGMFFWLAAAIQIGSRGIPTEQRSLAFTAPPRGGARNATREVAA